MNDIANRQDIIHLVDAFYSRVRADELLQPAFQHVDWAHHMPIMYNFWSSMILGDQSYQGSPFGKHTSLAIDASHFQRWLQLFTLTVDENFHGTQAEEIKNRARSIAGVFQHKLGLFPTGDSTEVH
jgi:hemoglobin